MPPENEDTIEDVNQAGSPPADQTADDTATAENTQDQTDVVNGSSTPPGTTDVDSAGVPWKNREAEIRRKLTEEMMPMIQQQIQDGIQRGLSQHQATQATSQPQPVNDPIRAQLSPYSDSDLEYLAESNEQWRPHARAEIARRIEERATKRAIETIKKESEQDRLGREQQEALAHISSRYEEAFIALPTGQKMWNTSSPLYQRAVSLYNSRPSFKTDGWGLAGAFDMAYGQLAHESKLQTTKQKTQLTAQQRRQDKAQAQAINSGAQAAPVAQTGNKAKLGKLMEQYKKTGDRNVMAEIIRLKGLMPAFD